MKSYIIILAEILLVIIFSSAMPIALYAVGQNELALYSTYVFGAIILWFSIVMIHLEYISRKVGKEDKLERARHLGYIHGLKEGVDNNPFKDDTERHVYRLGYDAGVSEYCRVAHPED